MTGLPKSELPDLKSSIITCLPLIIPIATLCVLLIKKYTPALSGAVCCVLILAMSLFDRSFRLTFRRFFLILEKCAIAMTSVIGIMACASIIVAIMSKTGFLLKSTSIVMLLSGGTLIGIVLINIIMSYIIGMGLPSASCYIILSALGAPAMIQLGVSPIAAHLLIFWFTQLAGITPPVCITAFVAAGIAESSPMKTGFNSLKMGSTFYLVPFLFLYSPLIDGSLTAKLLTVLLAALSFYMMNACFEGYLSGEASAPVRVLCGIDCLLLFFAAFSILGSTLPLILRAAGIILMVGLCLYQKRHQT